MQEKGNQILIEHKIAYTNGVSAAERQLAVILIVGRENDLLYLNLHQRKKQLIAKVLTFVTSHAKTFLILCRFHTNSRVHGSSHPFRKSNEPCARIKLSVRKKLPTVHTGQVIRSKKLSSLQSARVIRTKTIRQPFTSKDLSNDYSLLS